MISASSSSSLADFLTLPAPDSSGAIQVLSSLAASSAQPWSGDDLTSFFAFRSLSFFFSFFSLFALVFSLEGSSLTSSTAVLPSASAPVSSVLSPGALLSPKMSLSPRSTKSLMIPAVHLRLFRTSPSSAWCNRPFWIRNWIREAVRHTLQGDPTKVLQMEHSIYRVWAEHTCGRNGHLVIFTPGSEIHRQRERLFIDYPLLHAVLWCNPCWQFNKSYLRNVQYYIHIYLLK